MLKFLNLQRFAEGGEGADSGEATGVNGVPAPQASENSQPSPDDRTAQYNQFKEQFKAEWDSEVQSLVKDRLKKSNSKIAELQKAQKSAAPILDAAFKKYGVQEGNYEALAQAFYDDDANFEAEAYEKNMTVEQLKQFKKIERENRQLREAAEQRQMQEQFAQWDRQAEELRQIYPNFDINAEMQSESFRRLMDAGVDIRTAYEVSHKDELTRGAMAFTAAKVTEKVANSVAANMARPSENGLSSNSAAVAKTNIGSLSRAQMEEFKRRAAAGEHIDFKH